MSTANITDITPVEGGCIVTFQTKDGGIRSYLYMGDDALEILRGADPAGFAGQRIG